MPVGTYSDMWKMVAAYGSRYGTSRDRGSWLGVERSIWHRHIHWRALPPTREAIAAGWGSWTMHTSQPSESCSALIWLYRPQVSHCSSLTPWGLPGRALCISLVVLKNSSRP